MWVSGIFFLHGHDCHVAFCRYLRFLRLCFMQARCGWWRRPAARRETSATASMYLNVHGTTFSLDLIGVSAFYTGIFMVSIVQSCILPELALPSMRRSIITRWALTTPRNPVIDNVYQPLLLWQVQVSLSHHYSLLTLCIPHTRSIQIADPSCVSHW
jgi:hypothetical protein